MYIQHDTPLLLRLFRGTELLLSQCKCIWLGHWSTQLENLDWGLSCDEEARLIIEW